MRSALWLPLFGELADPRAVMRLASEAEEAGWHGVFVWDHVRWRAPVRHVGDPWITLAAVASATERVRLGPMVMPVPRRRPVKANRSLPMPSRCRSSPLRGPLRRAARYDGFFPVNLEHPDQLAEHAAGVAELRQDAATPFDLVVSLPVGVDPGPYASAGATWWLTEFEPEAVSVDQVRGAVRDGPLTT